MKYLRAVLLLCVAIFLSCAEERRDGSADTEILPENTTTSEPTHDVTISIDLDALLEAIEHDTSPTAVRTICLHSDFAEGLTAVSAAILAWGGRRLVYYDEPIPYANLDMLSAIAHELGHVLGFRAHLQMQSDVMFSVLPGFGGTRRHPTAEDFAAIPGDAPVLQLVDMNDSCDVLIQWGDTRYTTLTGEQATASCLTYSDRIVCNKNSPWYFLSPNAIAWE